MTLPLIFAPSSLPKFRDAGHTIAPGDNYAGVARGTGHSRKRPKSTGAPRVVTIIWALTGAQMADLDEWFQDTLDVGTEDFTAEVANQGPGQLFWRAKWVEPYVAEPQPTPRGLFWTVTGSIRLYGEGETTRPETGELAAEITVPLEAVGSLVLPETPLAAEILISFGISVPLRSEIEVSLTSAITPLATEIDVALDGEGALSAGGGSGTPGTSLTIEEEDGVPSETPDKLIFPNGTLTVDSNGWVHVDTAEFTYAATAPALPNPGARWVDEDTGILYTWVDDGTSTQWVEF